MRTLYKLLSILGTLKAAKRGPAALGRRQVRRVANREMNRRLRRWVKP